MPRRRSSLVAIGLFASAAMLSACGESGPSDKEFRAQAAKVCAGAVPSFSSVDRFAGVNPEARRFADHAAEVATKVEGLRDDLLDLDAPASLKDDFNEFTGHLAEMQRFWAELSELTQTKPRIVANLNALKKSEAYEDAGRLEIDSCVHAARALAMQVD